MKTVLLLAYFFWLSPLLLAKEAPHQSIPPIHQTDISGSITNDTTWSGDVLISGTTTVNSGVTVTVLPGTKVMFKHYRGYREPEKRLALRVYGAVIAEGTAQDPIYFTSDAPDPQNGDWSMLRLYSSLLQSRFRYVVFECAQHGLNVWHEDPLIAHCVFRWNNWEGIYFESYCTAELDSCLITENGYNGLAAEQFNTLTLRYCEVKRNGTSGIHADASTITVQDSWITENGAHGLSVDDNGSITALGDLIGGNGAWGIGVGEGNDTVKVGNCRISNNRAGAIGGTYSVVPYPLDPPSSMSVGFGPDSSYALGYIPGDTLLDKYQYVYPDDETRQVVSKIGKALGLTWSVAWDGSNIWTATLSGKIYKLNPTSGTILKQFDAPGSQPWGMTFDGRSLWLVDFAEKRISKIDTSSGVELKTFATPDSSGGCKGVAWDGRHLNILGWTTEVIYRVDTSGSLVGTIALQQGGNGGIAWTGKYFWVAGRKLLMYDTLGSVVGWIYPCSEGTWDMDWDGSCLWITQRTNENWRDAKLFRVQVLDDHSTPISLFVKPGGNDLLNGLNGGLAMKHIQNAIEAAPPRAIVRLSGGTYHESLVLLNKFLTIDGGYDSITWLKRADLQSTIVPGTGPGPVIRITSGAVALEGLVIQGGQALPQGAGGIEISGGATRLARCVVTRNSATGEGEWGGGAITMLDGVLTVSDCEILDNVALGGAGGLRLGTGARYMIDHTVVAGNAGRPAVHINDASGVFINCTVADNLAGGILLGASGKDTIRNCILWGNGLYDFAGEAPVVTYSDIQQNLAGTGNISSDPLFANSAVRDYHLLGGSPCIDKGDPESPPDADGSRADMGSYFFDHRSVGVENQEHPGIPSASVLYQNYPNPFNPVTTIKYTVGVASGRSGLSGRDSRSGGPEWQVASVKLVVYDLLGRQVATLVDEEKAPGNYEVRFSAKGGSPPKGEARRAGASGGDGSGLASGVYVYRLTAGSFVQLRKMILIK